MDRAGMTLFDTAIGRCGLAWTERGVAGLQLPEASEAQSRARMQERHAGAFTGTPPGEIKTAIEAVQSLIEDGVTDLGFIVLDEAGLPDFHRQVYGALRKVAAGQTRSYGQIAADIGSPGAARAVGQALGRNPYPVIVPCHRVLAAGGRAGGFTGPGGLSTKARLLRIEGVRLDTGRDLFGQACPMAG